MISVNSDKAIYIDSLKAYNKVIKTSPNCSFFTDDPVLAYYLNNKGIVNIDSLVSKKDNFILGDISLKIGDERAPITLNYTSGTTDNLKRLVIHHCGAYLNSLGNVFNLGFKRLTKYLWTLPMLHCNEWYHTWAITAAGGTHFCLDQANPALIVKALQEQEITHFSYAPLNVAG